MTEEGISNERKAAIASSLLMHAPPGEFNEVFNDVRILVNDDDLLKSSVSGIFAQYNCSQVTPVTLDQATDSQSLVTEVNDLGGGRYYDPRTKQEFMFDHVRRTINEISPSTNCDMLLNAASGENWRLAMQIAMDQVNKEHYKSGVCCVFGKPPSEPNATDLVKLIIYIESHNFKSKSFYNGAWRSIWTVMVPMRASGQTLLLKGKVKVQTHYFEDGNVQLLSSKDFEENVKCVDEKQFAKAVASAITHAENDYQAAVGENFNTMSDTTFKALRRQLPVTRAKIDWNKIINYRIGQELNRSN